MGCVTVLTMIFINGKLRAFTNNVEVSRRFSRACTGNVVVYFIYVVQTLITSRKHRTPALEARE